MSDLDALAQQRRRERAYQLWEQAGSPEGGDQQFWFEAKADIDQEEAQLDRALAESSPASDPPASSVITGATEDDIARAEVVTHHASQGAFTRWFRAWWAFPAKPE